jgi:hypothetical protein
MVIIFLDRKTILNWRAAGVPQIELPLNNSMNVPLICYCQCQISFFIQRPSALWVSFYWTTLSIKCLWVGFCWTSNTLLLLPPYILATRNKQLKSLNSPLYISSIHSDNTYLYMKIWTKYVG